MALKLVKQFKGYDAEYWKIGKCIYDTLNHKCYIILILYKDADTRIGDAFSGIITEKFVFDFEEQPTLEAVYSKIKEEINFLGAVDC